MHPTCNVRAPVTVDHTLHSLLPFTAIEMLFVEYWLWPAKLYTQVTIDPKGLADEAIMKVIAQQYQENRPAHDALAADWTDRFARP